MSNQLFQFLPLDKTHNRNKFKSNSEPLNHYFHKQVTQDIRRRITACFVALADEKRVAGYYTLAATSVLLNELPIDISKKLPRYPTVPAFRMGRLAVDQHYMGKGLGGALLADALSRSIRSEIAAYALMVDAKDNIAAAFYQHHGFIALTDSSMTLFLPLTTIQHLQ